jgi:hypothetical protein
MAAVESALVGDREATVERVRPGSTDSANRRESTRPDSQTT